MYNFDPYNVLLSIATNIPVLLMTAFVLQGHILIQFYNKTGMSTNLSISFCFTNEIQFSPHFSFNISETFMTEYNAAFSHQRL